MSTLFENKIKLINFILLVFLLFIIYKLQVPLLGFAAAIPGLFLTFYKDHVISSKRFLIILIILILAMPISLSTKNLISNSGFEEGLSGWDWISQVYKTSENTYGISKVNVSTESKISRSGNSSLSIINHQESGDQRYALVYQQVKVWPKGIYNITFYVRGNVPKDGLWVSISDDWSKEKGRYYVPNGQYDDWRKQGPIKLMVDDSHFATFKIISTVPGNFFIDDIKFNLNIIDSLKSCLV